MTKNQIIGTAILSTIPLGMVGVAIVTGSVGALLEALGLVAALALVVNTAFWFFDRGDQ